MQKDILGGKKKKEKCLKYFPDVMLSKERKNPSVHIHRGANNSSSLEPKGNGRNGYFCSGKLKSIQSIPRTLGAADESPSPLTDL